MTNRLKRFMIKGAGAMAFGAIWGLAWNKPPLILILVIILDMGFYLAVIHGAERDFPS